MTISSGLPVAVIGAGPVGLAAAVHLLARGETPVVLEAGDAVAASIREWSHVSFFSPWKYTVDAASVALLEPTGWTMPDPERAPTGAEIVERYLEPLAALPQITPRLRLGARVTAIARRGHDKMKTAGRKEAPFVLRVKRSDGSEEQILAGAVVDASGTWSKPNPLGAVQYASLRIAEVRRAADGLLLVGEDGCQVGPVDEIVCATGFRPDLAITRELRLDLDAAIEAPSALAPLIDPNVHSCATVPPHGAEQLKHPESDFYTVGMKSYGRAPTFLLLTGYEQVRSVVAAISGVWESARNVELVLPESGVCSTGDSPSSACCGTPTETAAFATFKESPDLLLPVPGSAATPSAGLTFSRTGLVNIRVVAAVPLNSCCSAGEQTTCCEPSDKASCCGSEAALASSGCGCR